jgi:hypothetical protein
MRYCAIIVALFIFSAPSFAAEMDYSLQAKLNESTSVDTIQALAYFNNQADIAALDQELRLEHATLAERNHRVILALQQAATEDQPEMASYLENLKSSGRIKDYRMFWIANMFWVEGSKAGLEAISTRQELSKVYLNYQIESIDPVKSNPAANVLMGHETGLEKIDAPAAWAHGWTGAGRVVMNIDTGVDGTHPALAARFRGDVNGDGNVSESWFDPYVTHYPTPTDSDVHGTHTMGTICGRTPDGDTIGVAIDATWIAAAAMDRGGSMARTIADAIASFQWAVDPDGNPDTQDNPDAIGNSWGVSDAHGYPPCDQTLWTVIDNCEAAGSAVIFSAGNEGGLGASTIRRPADRGTTPYNCFAVGAVNGNSPEMRVASWSSRGPSYCGPDGEMVIKPEVVAPGMAVRSSIPGGGYRNMDGTSMASPHVTGAIAVLRQVNPNLDVATLKQILIETAHEVPADSIPGEDNNYGNGIIDIYQACLVAQSLSLVEGTVRNIESSPISGSRIEIVGTSRNTRSSSIGSYAIAVKGDTSYQFRASAFGYIPQDTQVTVPSHDTISVDFALHPMPGGILYGYVRDSISSAPINGAIVRIQNTPIAPETTDVSGYYRFAAIPGGASYMVYARGAGHEEGLDSAFIPVGDSTLLNFSVYAFESFENSDAGWYGTGSWEWGVPASGPNAAFDGLNVWATNLTGNYPNSASDSLFIGYVTVDEPNASLSFYQWYDMESGWDGGNVAISSDGGANWHIISPVGGYPDNDLPGLNREPGFTGATLGWQQAVFNLSDYRGMAIIVRFRFGSDTAIQRAGWYIDAVSLRGATIRELGSPHIVANPDGFGVRIEPGNIISLPLTITNSGDGLLAFGIKPISTGRLKDNPYKIDGFKKPDANAAKPFDNAAISKNILSPGVSKLSKLEVIAIPTGPPMLFTAGGPDNFGYRWFDSQEPDGPRFNWVEISDRGQTLNMGDEDNQGPFALGFTMPFYDSTISSIRICSNGFLAINSGISDYHNTVVPDNSDPNGIMPIFWNDLNPTLGGEIFFYTNNVDSAIVTWEAIPHFGNNGIYTFEVILTSDGNISYQYLSMVGNLNQYTTGIENQDGTTGLQVACNQQYLSDSLAVKFLYPLFWLHVFPSAGYSLAGENFQTTVTFDARDLSEGTYWGMLIINSSDPIQPTLSLPCTLFVEPVGVAEQTGYLPTEPSLLQNYPNPFNPTTEIKFALPRASDVNLVVYDIMGREVRELTNGSVEAGYHSVIWDGKDGEGQSVASGIYFYTIKAGDFNQSHKMVLLK